MKIIEVNDKKTRNDFLEVAGSFINMITFGFVRLIGKLMHDLIRRKIVFYKMGMQNGGF